MSTNDKDQGSRFPSLVSQSSGGHNQDSTLLVGGKWTSTPSVTNSGSGGMTRKKPGKLSPLSSTDSSRTSTNISPASSLGMLSPLTSTSPINMSGSGRSSLSPHSVLAPLEAKEQTTSEDTSEEHDRFMSLNESMNETSTRSASSGSSNVKQSPKIVSGRNRSHSQTRRTSDGLPSSGATARRQRSISLHYHPQTGRGSSAGGSSKSFTQSLGNPRNMAKSTSLNAGLFTTSFSSFSSPKDASYPLLQTHSLVLENGPNSPEAMGSPKSSQKSTRNRSNSNGRRARRRWRSDSDFFSANFLLNSSAGQDAKIHSKTASELVRKNSNPIDEHLLEEMPIPMFHANRDQLSTDEEVTQNTTSASLSRSQKRPNPGFKAKSYKKSSNGLSNLKKNSYGSLGNGNGNGNGNGGSGPARLGGSMTRKPKPKQAVLDRYRTTNTSTKSGMLTEADDQDDDDLSDSYNSDSSYDDDLSDSDTEEPDTVVLKPRNKQPSRFRGLYAKSGGNGNPRNLSINPIHISPTSTSFNTPESTPKSARSTITLDSDEDKSMHSDNELLQPSQSLLSGGGSSCYESDEDEDEENFFTMVTYESVEDAGLSTSSSSAAYNDNYQQQFIDDEDYPVFRSIYPTATDDSPAPLGDNRMEAETVTTLSNRTMVRKTVRQPLPLMEICVRKAARHIEEACSTFPFDHVPIELQVEVLDRLTRYRKGLWNVVADDFLSDILQAAFVDEYSMDVLWQNNVTDSTILNMTKLCANLEQLQISGSQLEMPYLRLEYLVDFRIQGCHSMTELSLNAPHLKNLEVIFCSQIKVVRLLDDAGNPVQKHANLENLELSNIDDMELANLVSVCPGLQSIRVRNCFVSEETVQTLAESCPKLNCVAFHQADDITDESLEFLSSSCQYITTLELGDKNETDVALQISDSGVATVGRNCKMLQKFAMFGGPKVTNQGILDLVVNVGQTLQFLHLAGCSLTDDIYESLEKHAPELCELWLFECQAKAPPRALQRANSKLYLSVKKKWG